MHLIRLYYMYTSITHLCYMAEILLILSKTLFNQSIINKLSEIINVCWMIYLQEAPLGWLSLSGTDTHEG